MQTVPRLAPALLLSTLMLGFVAGCEGGGDSPPPAEIAVTRKACTPFGDPPRRVEPLLDTLFAASCTGGGGRGLENWTDAEGNPRQACLYQPEAASTDHKLPLVIYLHPSLVGVDITLALSNIRSQLDTADLSGDPQRPGFLLLAPYGRVTARYYPFPDNFLGPGWDNWYRQLQPGVESRRVNGEDYPQNVDAATIDHYLQKVLASGLVDERRIYVMGWSNGSAMGLLYSLNRPQVAAAALYTAPDPLAAFDDPCAQTPVAATPKDDTELQLFNPGVPIYHVHNACDIAGICPNGLRLEQRLIAAGTPFQGQIIDNQKLATDRCDALCGTDPNGVPAGLLDPLGYVQNLPGYLLGTLNHVTWPRDWTEEMFRFLREHPKR
ncbi:MAG: hypothetical protein EPN60_17340 [Nevskiaceae bacterium]|nr:MAG: hypothetical protein EPO48_11175 [Nevskiaceae bacterium]TAM22275.1 MAG: hypothetical protein EPN60_17340 [Nevskiaceae bacterium]